MKINPEASGIRTLAEWLLAHESPAGKTAEPEMYAAFRVCEKLRQSLSVLAGVAGYRALISRGLQLAKKEEPWLDSVRIREDGSLERVKTDDQQRGQDYDWQGYALVRQLLELLVVFIGEALTLRLVRDIWPNAPFKEAATGAGAEERA